MAKIAVVYWSGTGNTQAMAEAVLEGAKAGGAEADLLTASEFDVSKMDSYDAVAFGCPAMGAEVLEETEFDPFFTELESKISGLKVALFGSYGWGDGQWMRDWVERAQGDGAQVFGGEGLICNEAPDDDVQAACRKLGADLAAW